MSGTETLLSVDNLTLRVASPGGPEIVRNASLTVAPGEIVGIVGESGSGKTMLARSLMGLQPPVIERTHGRVHFRGQSILDMPPALLRRLRGAQMGMVFQEPMTSLNPSMTIGRQLEEPLRVHTKLDASERRRKAIEILNRVGMPDPEAGLKAYPHEFSGGMRQRIMLASAMLLRPALLIADEPTTALDALIQRDVLELMLELTQDDGTALLMISHDLPMVARYCQRVIVMRQGEIVESGSTEEILRAPAHPYTRDLLQAMPVRGPNRTFSEKTAPVISVRGIEVVYRSKTGILAPARTKHALKGIDLDVRAGEVVAVVGSSGSGKTTLGRAIAGLIAPSSGQLSFRGQPVSKGSSAYRDYRLNCQMIFQDPFGSLDPRMTIGALVAEPLRHEQGVNRAQAARRVAEILSEVGLDANFVKRYPHELSGGQRQRVAIARAIIGRPDFVIADEAVSALDVTVRAQVLELLASLQRRYNFSCLFISHDLAVVEQLADRVVVMDGGEIVEQGPRDAIFDRPASDYTRALLSAIPTLVRTEHGVAMSWRFPREAAKP
ncbi:ABC transporter ATP-binding protein [Pelagibacterium halotolerans]|uniref:Transporter of small molecules n=1 Tax=Pelagibacterium halotolerans (strain DSM 22347 / JCM 15775 / CGMCC 1.7692 / B2) TaxID=1082931 RepID=G4RD60_PELHB|nr:ABC transporter ATP-binding protein [Pelagibacterium halotolerans]AEQ53810.1 transporter of small molecules [Pelagibacterium halotolerans B2]QJR20035.1 ABC transporter ATP-binding protein [Pelagibacterium halotolerans]SEA81492.1 peptide/nickel transport system ATP-binding protein [Pelagibacterium halotolerans]